MLLPIELIEPYFTRHLDGFKNLNLNV